VRRLGLEGIFDLVVDITKHRGGCVEVEEIPRVDEIGPFNMGQSGGRDRGAYFDKNNTTRLDPVENFRMSAPRGRV